MLDSLPLINKCEDLPLELFIRISVDGDHTRLGKGDTESAWADIQLEYNALTGTDVFSGVLGVLRDINFLSAKINVVSGAVELMQKYYIPEMGNILHKYGFRFTWENIPEDQYYQQLKTVVSQSKTWLLQLKVKEKEWEELSGKGSDSKTTRDFFEDWLMAFSKEQGYHIKSQDISTYQFALMLRKATQPKGKKQPVR